MIAQSEPLQLTVGGAVNARTGVYIVRPCDAQLLELLKRGEYCNVLSSRQVGKTSLLKRTRWLLWQEGYHTAEVEVAGYLGSPTDANEWYQGLLHGIVRDLKLDVDVEAWWRASRAITANQKLIQFFREEVIAKLAPLADDKPIIIFLDEIDSTLALKYTDDFFVAIRAMYNDRASDPLYQKIAFCLVGVATPNELIKEKRTTPYNIGKTIELPDFDPDRDDLTPLYRAACPADVAQGEAIVRAVIRETGGHPYLTARLLDLPAVRKNLTPNAVAAVVREQFASLDEVKNDVHFDTMLRFINERVDDKRSTLELYREVLRGKPVPDQTTPAHLNLKLIGLVKRDRQGNLAPRNPIYVRLFNLDFVAKTILEKLATLPLSPEESMVMLNLNDLVTERLNQFRQNPRYAEITFEANFQSLSPLLVKGNPEWLRQAVDILLDNSAQAVRSSMIFDPTRSVITVSTAQEGHMVELRVKDRGHGISIDLSDKLFVSRIETTPDKHLGFGLLIAQAVVKAHGGQILLPQTGTEDTEMLIRLPQPS